MTALAHVQHDLPNGNHMALDQTADPASMEAAVAAAAAAVAASQMEQPMHGYASGAAEGPHSADARDSRHGGVTAHVHTDQAGTAGAPMRSGSVLAPHAPQPRDQRARASTLQPGDAGTKQAALALLQRGGIRSPRHHGAAASRQQSGNPLVS
jgi:hypothetical protein